MCCVDDVFLMNDCMVIFENGVRFIWKIGLRCNIRDFGDWIEIIVVL